MATFRFGMTVLSHVPMPSRSVQQDSSMQARYHLFSRAAALALATSLAGCANGPLAEAVTRAYNLNMDYPPEMVNRHLAAWVGFDEDWAGNYNAHSRNVLYVQGVPAGSPAYRQRIGRINLVNSGEAVLWVGKGELGSSTGAFVPDHLPRLHAGDIVEVRQTGTWKTMQDFVATGEGNIVVRILCRKGTPDFDKCLDAAPRIGKAKGAGETGTPYPAGVRDYGFTFTPMFDDKGRALRPYPTAGVALAY